MQAITLTCKLHQYVLVDAQRSVWDVLQVATRTQNEWFSEGIADSHEHWNVVFCSADQHVKEQDITIDISIFPPHTWHIIPAFLVVGRVGKPFSIFQSVRRLHLGLLNSTLWCHFLHTCLVGWQRTSSSLLFLLPRASPWLAVSTGNHHSLLFLMLHLDSSSILDCQAPPSTQNI